MSILLIECFCTKQMQQTNVTPHHTSALTSHMSHTLQLDAPMRKRNNNKILNSSQIRIIYACMYVRRTREMKEKKFSAATL